MTAKSELPSKRRRFGLDSSCVIALLNDWHEHHRITLDCYEAQIAAKWTPIVPVHVILEAFSVMTRLPVPYRMAPDMAKLVIETSFCEESLIEPLAAETMWSAMDSLAAQGLGGGRIYDAMIAASVHKAGAQVLFTWNVKHFAAIAPAALEIRQPASRG